MTQLPQCAGLVRSVSQPLAWFPSQSPHPALQEASAHVPVAQLVTALGSEHATPHPPHDESLVKLVSQPFAALPSQSPRPVAQWDAMQVPLRQVSPGLQAFPQAPQ